MRRSLITASALVLTFSAGIIAAPAAAARVNAATEIFYGCQSDFSFEATGSSAHCKKPAYTDHRKLADCTLLFPATDRIGNKDMCAATNPLSGEIGVERACKLEDRNDGYTKRTVPGLDYCGKLIPQQIQPPDRAISVPR